MTSTTKRAQTMAARYLTPAQLRAIADKQARTTTRTSTRVAPRNVAPVRPQISDRQASMVGKLATVGQMEAINGYERTLGLKGYASLREFRAIVGDMAAASVLRASLKAQIYG